MKFLFTAVLLFYVSFVFAQNEVRYISYYYSENNKEPITDTIRVKAVDAAAELTLLSKLLNLPEYMPERLINRSYKNNVVTHWYDETGEVRRKIDKYTSVTGKDSLGRISYDDYRDPYIPTYTYIYDSLSRLTFFSFDGCENCTRIPEMYELVYDRSNRLVKLIEDYFFKETIEIIYNLKGNIVEAFCYIEENDPFLIIKRE